MADQTAADETVFGPGGQPQRPANKRRPDGEMLRGVPMYCACGKRMHRHKTANGANVYYRCVNRRPDDPDQRHTRPIPCDDAGQPTS